MFYFVKMMVKFAKMLCCRSCPAIATNENVFMKKGGFGTRQPVTGAGFCSNFELLPTAS
jgi:hypothetical protein